MTLIFQTVHGSHLYGLAHAGSDVDIYKVVEGDSRRLQQVVTSETDTVTGSIGAFLMRASEGSHQSVEALFSRKKAWTPGMEEKWGPFIDSIRVTGPEVFAKYERTIKAFCYGDFKRRRHAARLALNLRYLRLHGRFNPTLDQAEVDWVNGVAFLEGERLHKFLLDNERPDR